jgi:hypothetical protein
VIRSALDARFATLSPEYRDRAERILKHVESPTRAI